jgi:hypothetical protein
MLREEGEMDFLDFRLLSRHRILLILLLFYVSKLFGFRVSFTSILLLFSKVPRVSTGQNMYWFGKLEYKSFFIFSALAAAAPAVRAVDVR